MAFSFLPSLQLKALTLLHDLLEEATDPWTTVDQGKLQPHLPRFLT